MKNYIIYYYNLNIDEIHKNNNYYYFYINNDLYEFKIYERNTNEINSLYKINKNLLEKTLIDELILNKQNNVISIINNIPYYLVKKYANKEKIINLSEISFISNIKVNYEKEIMRSNWTYLWSKNIDYFEYQINQLGKKYPNIVNSFSYYIGLAENAISYINETTKSEKKELSDIGVLSHRKITNKIDSLYEITNIIIDHKARDLSEYIKLSFWNNNKNIYKELDEYFKNNYYSLYAIRLLYGRILYPNYYFELYEEIIANNKKEKEIINITSKVKEYEEYLIDIYYYLNKFYNIPQIDWLKKRS